MVPHFRKVVPRSGSGKKRCVSNIFNFFLLLTLIFFLLTLFIFIPNLTKPFALNPNRYMDLPKIYIYKVCSYTTYIRTCIWIRTSIDQKNWQIYILIQYIYIYNIYTNTDRSNKKNWSEFFLSYMCVYMIIFNLHLQNVCVWSSYMCVYMIRKIRQKNWSSSTFIFNLRHLRQRLADLNTDRSQKLKDPNTEPIFAQFFFQSNLHL